MVHTLRALESAPELLLNMMDVFVKEPSVDWKVGWVCVDRANTPNTTFKQ